MRVIHSIRERYREKERVVSAAKEKLWIFFNFRIPVSMDKIVRMASSCAQTLFFIHAINLLVFILNKYTPVFMLALDEYFSRLLEITVWPVLDFFSESLKKKDLNVEKEDMVWDTGWQPHRTAIWNITNFIRFFTCLIFLPQYHGPVSLGMNKFINSFCYYLKSFYKFLTVERFIYLYLTVFFAIKFLSGPFFMRFKNNEQREKNDDTSTRSLSSHSNQLRNSSTSDDNFTDDEIDEDRSSRFMVNSLGFLVFPRRRGRSPVERMCTMCSHYGDHSVLLPCGHTDLCFHCSRSYQNMGLACPFCATHIRSCHRILL